jgi:hypothetical protein
MDGLGSLTRTGQKVSGPASDLVELENDKGLRHLAVMFHRKYRDHDAINGELAEISAFLRAPDVCDLLELVEVVPDSGAFVYPAGSALSVAEMLEVLARLGEPAGVKAGLEMAYQAAQILQDAYTKGEKFGLFSHGDISPWRILCKNDGQVQLIGFGLPQVDVLAFVEDNRAVPKEDGFRYCPPERLAGEEEDFASDLFSLALVAAEMMLGEPLYNGIVTEIRQQATNAQGPYRLYPYRDRLPEPVMELLTRCLKADVDARHSDINEFIWEARDLLGMPEVEGPSLAEVVQKVRHKLRRKRVLQGGATSAMTNEELAEIAEELDGPRRLDLKEPSRPRPGDEPKQEEGQRWGRVSRSGGREPRRSAAKEPSRSERLASLRRSGSRSGPSDARSSLKDRLRRSRGRDDSRGATARSGSGLRRSRGGEASPGPIASREASPPAAEPRTARASSLLGRLKSSREEAEAPSVQAAPADPPHTVRVTLGGAVAAVQVPVEASVWVLVHRAAEVLPTPASALTGTVEAWFGPSIDGEPVDSDATVGDVGDAIVELTREPAALAVARVHVEGHPDIRLRSPVNTALTAGAVLGQLLQLLELEGLDWHIAVDGAPLHPLQPLGDVVAENEVTLVVSK